jgi:putative membrane protein
MDKSTKALVLGVALAATTAAFAQAPPTTPADPEAASSPHQRAATGAAGTEAPATPSPEASAASSPHQHATAVEGTVSDAKLKMAQQDGAIPATFVKKAALDGMTEVELGKVALTKSQDANVRKFAERMVKDHGKANTELATIAKSKQLDVPKTLDAEHQAMVQALSSKSGAAFDSAYGEHMNADHSKAIALFEGASSSSDADLAGFAKKTLPTLKDHKQMADDLPKMRSASAGADAAKK